MTTLSPRDSLADAVCTAIRSGQVGQLRQILTEHPEVASCWIGADDPNSQLRSVLHVATDWPGHCPNVGETIAVLVQAGADINARFRGPHHETPLHWAASSDDLEAIDALLDAGAGIDVDGGVIGGGTPLNDATAFARWGAARRLVVRGARANAFDLAALGMTEQVLAIVDGSNGVSSPEVNSALWAACHGSQLGTAKALRGRGADINWLPPWEAATPLDAAIRSRADQVIRWLLSLGAKTCANIADG